MQIKKKKQHQNMGLFFSTQVPRHLNSGCLEVCFLITVLRIFFFFFYLFAKNALIFFKVRCQCASVEHRPLAGVHYFHKSSAHEAPLCLSKHVHIHFYLFITDDLFLDFCVNYTVVNTLSDVEKAPPPQHRHLMVSLCHYVI